MINFHNGPITCIQSKLGHDPDISVLHQCSFLSREKQDVLHESCMKSLSGLEIFGKI